MSGWGSSDVGAQPGDLAHAETAATLRFGPTLGLGHSGLGFLTDLGQEPARLVAETALASVQLAQTHLDSATSQLAAIRLDEWQGNAAKAALQERARLEALISQAQTSAAQAAWAVSVQREAASVKLVCAATTGVY